MGMGRAAERTDDVGSTMIESAAHCEYRQAAGAGRLRTVMDQLLLQSLWWRDEMIKRGVARYNWQTGKWEWGERQAGPTRPAYRQS